MEALAMLFVALGAIAIVVLIVRAFGAWMLRINEVIQAQKETTQALRDIQHDMFRLSKGKEIK